MRFVVLATDYDETLAKSGRVPSRTIDALERLQANGRRWVLVTGRELDDLLRVFPEAARADAIVAENGALLYLPATREERALGEPPPPAFVEALQARDVQPLSVGQVIVSTREPHAMTVVEEIHRLGLELQVVFNKGAVMILPPGVNKGTGLEAALDALGLSRHNTVAVGDAENDHAMLAISECAVAVANALPSLQERADLVTRRPASEGVETLISWMLDDDLASATKPAPVEVPLGRDRHGRLVGVQVGRGVVLFVGGPGRSSAAKGLGERLVESGYQICVVDCEGDWQAVDRLLGLGDARRAPSLDEVMQALDHPREQVAVNLASLAGTDGSRALGALWPRLLQLRAVTGRPHFVLIDDASALLPAGALPLALAPSPANGVYGLALVASAPHQLSPATLAQVTTVIAVGERAPAALGELCARIGVDLPSEEPCQPGQALFWRRGEATRTIELLPTRAQHHRQLQKLVTGELAPDRCFYFRGRTGKLRLRAQNLTTFVQLADGVDDQTWLHHLRNGDYSRWFRDQLRDEALADETERIERDVTASAAESRRRIRGAVERRYGVAAEPLAPV